MPLVNFHCGAEFLRLLAKWQCRAARCWRRERLRWDLQVGCRARLRQCDHREQKQGERNEAVRAEHRSIIGVIQRVYSTPYTPSPHESRCTRTMRPETNRFVLPSV